MSHTMVILGVLGAPLVAALFLGVGSGGGTFGARFFSVAGPAVSFAAAVIALVGVLVLPSGMDAIVIDGPTWFGVGDFSVRMGLVFDSISAVFILLTSLLFGILGWFAACRTVHGRRLAWLQLALSATCFALLAADPVGFLAGWILAGLFIVLMTKGGMASDAGSTLTVMQRVADFALLSGIAILLSSIGESGISFTELIARVDSVSPFSAVSSAVLIGLAALIRAGIMPFHGWMNVMMDRAPASASAAAIAAGIAPAGVYLIARFSFLYGIVPDIGVLLSWFSVIMALVAAVAAGFQSDIRRVIIYVSASHLGLVFVALGLGAYPAAIYLAVVHGLSITLLVLSAGIVVVETGTGDMWRMGALRKRLFAPHMATLVGTLVAAGLPPLSGFFAFSGIGYSTYVNGFTGMWAITVIVVGFIAYALFRALFLVFYGTPRQDEDFDRVSDNAFPGAAGPLSVLAVAAVFTTFLSIPRTLGGLALFSSWLTPSLVVPDLHDLGRRSALLLMLTLAGSGIAGTLVAYQAFWRDARRVPQSGVRGFIGRLFTVIDGLAVHGVARSAMAASRFLARTGDLVIDRGVRSKTLWLMNRAARLLGTTQNGMARAYSLYMAVGIALAALYLYRMMG